MGYYAGWAVIGAGAGAFFAMVRIKTDALFRFSFFFFLFFLFFLFSV